MDASALNFTDGGISNGNLAIGGLKSQIATTVDSDGNKVWQYVGFGIGLPSYSEDDPLTVLDVHDEQSPCCLIFDGLDEHVSRATDWMDTEILLRVRLQFFINVLGSGFGSYPEVQSLRRNITRATLRTLRPVSKDNPTGMPAPQLVLGQFPWWIEEPQTALANYQDDLNNLFPKFPIVPPWWTWHVNIAMRATNV